MADLKKMVEFLDKVSMEEGFARHQLLLAIAKDMQFFTNCITDLRKENEANKEEIEKLKVRHNELTLKGLTQ